MESEKAFKSSCITIKFTPIHVGLNKKCQLFAGIFVQRVKDTKTTPDIAGQPGPWLLI